MYKEIMRLNAHFLSQVQCKSTILATISMLIIHFFTFQQDQEELLARPAASEVELSQDLE